MVKTHRKCAPPDLAPTMGSYRAGAPACVCHVAALSHQPEIFGDLLGPANWLVGGADHVRDKVAKLGEATPGCSVSKSASPLILTMIK